MRYGRVLSVLAVVAVLSLLAAVVPARPALAAPAVQLSPGSGAVGTRVTVTGMSFDSYKGDRVSVFFGPLEIVGSPVTVPDSGQFETYFEVPDNTLPGAVAVSVRGPIGSVLAESSFMVEAPEIWSDADRGPVGTTVTMMARGFYVNKIVVFYYDHNGVTTKLGTEVAGPTGECSYSFVVPPGYAGEHRITAENQMGHRVWTMFEVLPQATISPLQGAVGDIIGMSGTGFAPREEVSVYLKTSPVAYANTDATGSFEGAFKVPAFPNGSYAMRIEDMSRNRMLMQFAITAGAHLSSTAGHVGTEVVVSGNGFAAGGTVIVQYDGAEAGRTSADEDGSFTVTFEAPSSDGGVHTVVVTDGTDTAELVFTMESTPPSTPVRRLPEPEAEAVSPVSFSWTAVDDLSQPVSYTVQVANDRQFTDVVLEKAGVTEAEYTAAGGERLRASKEEAYYYWRVKAVDAASNESQWSDAGSFRVVPSFAMPSWAIYVLIGIAAVLIGLLAFRLWRRSRASYWD